MERLGSGRGGSVGCLTNVTAAVLAGGLGTRLRPVVDDRPKVLAEVRGRPFLTYLLDQLVTAGVGCAVLCTGYLGEQVQATFGAAYGRLRLIYSQERSPLDTAGALRLALPLLTSETVLVMNGDSWCDVDLAAFWASHCGRAAEGSLVLAETSDTMRYGRVYVDAEGFVRDFDEKGRNNESGWINAGVYLLKRRLVQRIPDNRSVSLEREMFPAWIGRGLYGYRGAARFLDIGTPEAYALAEHFFTPGPAH